MDYFKMLEKQILFCLVCKSKCEPLLNAKLCKCCMLEYTTEYNKIYDKIANYYDNLDKYNINFVQTKREQANMAITSLKIKYHLA